MLRFFASCISAVLLFGSAPQASADILQATFVGTYRGHVNGTFLYFGGQSPQSVPYSALLDDPYVAAFLFDTTLGTLSSPSPGCYAASKHTEFVVTRVERVGCHQ